MATSGTDFAAMAASGIDPHVYTKMIAVTKTVRRNPYEAILPTNPKNSQKGRIIIITGASSGIGEAAAKVWARAGASGIVLAARRLEPLEKLSSEIKEISPDTTVLAVKTDISSVPDAKNLFAQIQKTYGRVADVLLNNAGYNEEDTFIASTPTEQWWKTFEINTKGTYNMTHEFIQAQTNPKEPVGTIINVSSGRASLTLPGGSAYDISKLDQQRLTEHLQLENPTLRVFTTMPGITPSAMSDDTPDWHPFRLDHVDLTGMQALYLVQERADYLKGSMVAVNWDVEELEQHKEKIEKEKPFMTSWLPILPALGGMGLEDLTDLKIC